MDVSELVLTDGARVTALGVVVAAGGAVWFDPPLPVPAIHYPPGSEPAPRPSGLGVPVDGIDLDRLADRFAKNGAVRGWARLTGTWVEPGRLVVTGQEPARPGGAAPPEPARWIRPPCPEPRDGWPHGPLEAGAPAEAGIERLVVNRTVFRPAPDREVLVVAAERPERVEAALRPGYGTRLCVVASRWTRRQVDAVTDALRTGMRDWLVYESGTTSTMDGQVVVTARLARLLPGFVAWVVGVPDGLLEVSAWLAPDRGSGH